MRGSNTLVVPGAASISCCALRNTSQAIADSVATPISFDSTYVNTSGMWVIGAPTRITIPSTGFYAVEANIAFDAVTLGVRRLQIWKNGAATGFCAAQLANTAAVETAVNGYFGMPLVAGDYLELLVYQNSTLTVNAVTLEFATNTLTVTRVKG